MRSVTVAEPEWDDEQAGWMLALADVEADACPGCGQPRSESTTEDAEGMYEVDDPYECQACVALSIRQQRSEHQHPAALQWVVTRRPVR